MEERKIIHEKLKKKEQEIQSLEEKLRSARIYVQALQDVLKLVDTNSAPETGESALKAGSAVNKARETILRRGKPVHINDLLEAVGKEVTRESRASLTSSIAAYVRRGEIFTRPAPNTFGLVELGHKAVVNPAPPQPPQGFGKIQPSPPVSHDMDDEIPLADDDGSKF
ncbi:winged helix-turn-helix domain-containing protein [Bradyrhizobium sediminis]|uniref:Winged helix-turn-helix domain-containing protein n=1 Tax=Bradyrhizobium sediminis TaxID=2840469 RepID=A0A975RYL0_9BRAD|nr:winged helix-turn-helix domain-containing protein [Bradyrhizobium sediminis]QWG24313.1 winged helix-turn-helix domain-containing protein [Bradyrhizobium sediminis]